MSRSPPTISDSFDDAIAPPLKMYPLTKVIRIRAEEFALPGVAQALSGAPTEATNALVKMAPSVGLASAETLKGEREGWSVYRLEDGTILKVSQLLMDIGGTKLEPDSIAQEVTMQLSNVFMALSIAPNLRGTPSKQQYSPAELAAAVVKKNLKFERISETVNSYITTTGDRLGLNLALMDVSRTNKYDASGNPIYLVNTQVSIQQLVRDSA